MSNPDDEQFMYAALAAARRSGACGEVPVGAVLVHDGRIVAEGGNAALGAGDPTAHAEIVALRRAARVLGNYRLPGTCLYVTLEPCCMCVGALIHARVERLVYGADDPKTGAVHSVFGLLQAEAHNHRVAVTGGVLAQQCGDLLREFFRARRGVAG